MNEKLAFQQIAPAANADDATFFRRINLALAGRIPEAAEVRAFLADTSPEKRTKAIDRLLDSPAFVNFFTKSWRGWLLEETANNVDVANGVPEFEAWLSARMRADAPLDKLVTELLAYPLDEPAGAQQVNPRRP